MSTPPHIAVVGGGLAGITAALDCAATGAAVTLAEVRPRLGGAAYSYTRGDLRLDNGQHVFLRCCNAYRALLGRLGREDDVVLQPRLDLPILAPGRRPVRLRRSGLPAPLQLAGALARYGLLSRADRLGVVRAMLALRAVDTDDRRVDARSFGDWLREHRQSPEAIERVWRLIATPTLNLEPDDASLAQAAYVFQRALLQDAGAGDIGWSRVPLSDLHDGPARRALAAAGVDVRLRARVDGVARAGEGGFALSGLGAPLRADAVVLAVPPERAGPLLVEGALPDPGAPARLGRSPIVNLHLVYDRRVLDEPMAVAVDAPVSWMFDRTDGSGLERGQLVSLSLSAADDLADTPAEQLRDRAVGALRDLLPAAAGAQVQAFHVTREHAATFRVAPGARALRPPARTAVDGFVLAGGWTDTGWPATMESAVLSGHAAAAEAIAATHRTSRPAAVAA
ncbi:hydroxysqualene dehydroxylase HpnE [Baekduia soli]|uniref:hydroxysqualene dehydroxylase HpnE n=1 Tax=Baekduia soli TaxID=496014 RepID=UPI002AA29F8E|nr:hydroxysqualene dehydroxylase HpnE [Baekduia soli]